MTAAGGTTLAKDPSVSRGWDETAWDSGGPTAGWAAQDQPSAEERRILALLTAGTLPTT